MSQLTGSRITSPIRSRARTRERHSPFNRHEGGQNFGTHVDNAVRRSCVTGDQIRTDLSAALFLSDPEEYDGGSWSSRIPTGSKRIKLQAGSLILYPASSLHHVTPVTRGARVSSFFWVQSMIRDDGKRTILFDMDTAIQRLAAQDALHPSVVQLTGVYHNLLRRWAEL